MCFPLAIPLAIAAVTALSSGVSQAMSMNAQNKAAASAYNQQARYAEKVNQAALQQQAETDSRNRTERARQAENAADKTRQTILENRRAQGAALASAGTSGLMGLPLNMIAQNYQAMIGTNNTQLDSYNQQLDENYFYNSIDSALRANSISNQAVPMKPVMQSFGIGNVLSAGLSGLSAGLGAYNPGPKAGAASTFQPSRVGSAQPLGPTYSINGSM